MITKFPRRKLDLQTSAPRTKDHLPLVMATDVVDDMNEQHIHSERVLEGNTWRVCHTEIPVIHWVCTHGSTVVVNVPPPDGLPSVCGQRKCAGTECLRKGRLYFQSLPQLDEEWGRLFWKKSDDSNGVQPAAKRMCAQAAITIMPLVTTWRNMLLSQRRKMMFVCLYNP